MDEKLLADVLKRVQGEMGQAAAAPAKASDTIAQAQALTEFVGVAEGDTIGLVIANLDDSLVEKLDVGKYRSIGIIGSRAGLGPQVMAADEAVKATNSELIRLEPTNDDKGGAGQSALIYIGAEDVSDVKRAVEIALDATNRYFGDLYTNEAGHLEFQYTARASFALNKAFGAPLGKAFGLLCAGPAVLGAVLADMAVKTANVEVIEFYSPAFESCNANESTLIISGDSGAVKQAIKSCIEPGKKLLGALGSEPQPVTTPYI